ncbi:MAG: TspO/MBR family protein [Bacillota bacterium]|nr:TspO/MBR family protein [Bacillota bacterium]
MFKNVFENMSKEGKAYAFFIILCEAVGLISGLISMMGMMDLDDVIQSDLTPPSILFPIVWTILYALMGIGAARVYLAEESLEQIKGLIVFFLQLAVNFIWSIIFFNLQAFQLAFWWLLLLWVLIIIMIVLFWKSDRLAAILQIPYLLWVTFAGYLTYMIWMLN